MSLALRLASSGDSKSESIRVTGEIWREQPSTSRLASIYVAWRPHAQVGGSAANSGPNQAQILTQQLIDP
ncbi:hypothetical protein A2U01_0014861 [Trifolium medium]|uniref:Uncharacterized protein n=1 Tax=Trifolium medium TaxID=97028 RepID=A0A392N265_9FABA|nr:hypothetical protein [Trifolium medium]